MKGSGFASKCRSDKFIHALRFLFCLYMPCCADIQCQKKYTVLGWIDANLLRKQLASHRRAYELRVADNNDFFVSSTICNLDSRGENLSGQSASPARRTGSSDLIPYPHIPGEFVSQTLQEAGSSIQTLEWPYVVCNCPQQSAPTTSNVLNDAATS